SSSAVQAGCETTASSYKSEPPRGDSRYRNAQVGDEAGDSGEERRIDLVGGGVGAADLLEALGLGGQLVQAAAVGDGDVGVGAGVDEQLRHRHAGDLVDRGEAV